MKIKILRSYMLDSEIMILDIGNLNSDSEECDLEFLNLKIAIPNADPENYVFEF